MVVLRGGAVSYERGTPAVFFVGNSGRLKSTVRRHKFNKYSPFLGKDLYADPGGIAVLGGLQPGALPYLPMLRISL